MATPETFIRPFTDDGVTPSSYIKPGAKPNEAVILRIGYRGGTKTFATTSHMSGSLYMSKKHMESPSRSKALQGEIKSAANASSYNGNLANFKDVLESDSVRAQGTLTQNV